MNSLTAKKLRPLFTVLCVVAGLIFLAPLIWLLVGSFWPSYAPISDLARAPLTFRPTAANYVVASTLVPMGRFALNSLRVVLIAVPSSLLIASLAAFTMTQLSDRARVTMLWISLAALMAPSRISP